MLRIKLRRWKRVAIHTFYTELTTPAYILIEVDILPLWDVDSIPLTVGKGATGPRMEAEALSAVPPTRPSSIPRLPFSPTPSL